MDNATQLSQTWASTISSTVERVQTTARELEQAVQPVNSAVQTVSRGVQKLARGEVDSLSVDVVAGAAAIIAVAGLPLVYMATRPNDILPLTKGNSNDLGAGGGAPPPPPAPLGGGVSSSLTGSQQLGGQQASGQQLGGQQLGGQQRVSSPPAPAAAASVTAAAAQGAANDPRTYNAEDAVISAESLRVAAESLRASKAAALYRLGAARVREDVGSVDVDGEVVGTSFDGDVEPGVVNGSTVNGLPPRAYPTDETIGTSFEVCVCGGVQWW